MTDSTGPVNVPVEILDDALGAVLSVGLEGLETALNVWQPWTATPVLKQLIDLGLGWIKNEMYQFIAVQGTFLILDFQTSEEKSSYIDAVNSLKTAQAGTDQDAITKARQDFDNALAALGHWDGSRQP